MPNLYLPKSIALSTPYPHPPVQACELTLRSFFQASFITLLLLLLTQGLRAESSNPQPDPDLKVSYLGGIVRIEGKIVEKSTGAPFKLAQVIAKSGSNIIASIFSDKEGNFTITILPEKIRDNVFSLKVKHMDHVFIKEHIGVEVREMLIEINGEIFLEEQVFEEYRLPVHSLDQPQVGNVTIWNRSAPEMING